MLFHDATDALVAKSMSSMKLSGFFVRAALVGAMSCSCLQRLVSSTHLRQLALRHGVMRMRRDGEREREEEGKSGEMHVVQKERWAR